MPHWIFLPNAHLQLIDIYFYIYKFLFSTPTSFSARIAWLTCFETTLYICMYIYVVHMYLSPYTYHLNVINNMLQ